MHRVDRVLLRLEPVARHLREHDLHETVLPRERLPVGEERRGPRAEIGPEKPGFFLHRIGRSADSFLQPSLRIEFLLERLLDALASFVVHPAVIVASQAAFLDVAVGEVRRAVPAMPRDQAVRPREVLVEHEVLSHDAHGLDRVLVEFAHRGDRMPVAAQELAHRRARADLGQRAGLFRAQHHSTFAPEALMSASHRGKSLR